jgi:uncharacterized protein YjbI with pentapeptide repeats
MIITDARVRSLLDRYAAGGRDFSKVELENADLTGADLSGANLSGANLRSAALRRAVLNEANLSGADLTNAALDEAKLSGANLSGANLSEANLNGAEPSQTFYYKYRIEHRVDLSGAVLNNANLSGAYLNLVNLSGAVLNSANLTGANLSGANLNRANLSGANLECANLERANLERANLEGANLEGANLTDAGLSRANLGRADFSRAAMNNAIFSGADLSGAKFSGADLSEAHLGYRLNPDWLHAGKGLGGPPFRWHTNLRDADLSDANLSGADLTRANLQRANLNRADLTRARLSGAKLNGASLRDADLTGADLSYATLRYAYLRGAVLKGANLRYAEVRRTYPSEEHWTGARLSGRMAAAFAPSDTLNPGPFAPPREPGHRRGQGPNGRQLDSGLGDTERERMERGFDIEEQLAMQDAARSLVADLGFHTDWNIRYHEKRRDFFEQWERHSNLVVLVLASALVVFSLAQLFWLSAVTGVGIVAASVLGLVLKPSESARFHIKQGDGYRNVEAKLKAAMGDLPAKELGNLETLIDDIECRYEPARCYVIAESHNESRIQSGAEGGVFILSWWQRQVKHFWKGNIDTLEMENWVPPK